MGVGCKRAGTGRVILGVRVSDRMDQACSAKSKDGSRIWFSCSSTSEGGSSAGHMYVKIDSIHLTSDDALSLKPSNSGHLRMGAQLLYHRRYLQNTSYNVVYSSTIHHGPESEIQSFNTTCLSVPICWVISFCLAIGKDS